MKSVISLFFKLKCVSVFRKSRKPEHYSAHVEPFAMPQPSRCAQIVWGRRGEPHCLAYLKTCLHFCFAEFMFFTVWTGLSDLHMSLYAKGTCFFCRGQRQRNFAGCASHWRVLEHTSRLIQLFHSANAHAYVACKREGEGGERALLHRQQTGNYCKKQCFIFKQIAVILILWKKSITLSDIFVYFPLKDTQVYIRISHNLHNEFMYVKMRLIKTKCWKTLTMYSNTWILHMKQYNWHFIHR